MLTPVQADGVVTNLTSNFTTADFNGADVSFDATQAVFSMKTTSDDHYHIYTVQLTPGANGTYELHQKTAGDYDDINPFYMPGNLIGFVTNEMYTEMGTRADEYDHSRVVVQLATISVDGGDADRRLFPQSLSHTVAPSLRHDGKIMYSRWEHLGPTNDVKLFAANPDGTQMIAVGGQHGKPSNSLFSVKETATPNVFIGIGTDRERTIHAGALIQIDSRNQSIPACVSGTAEAQNGLPCLDEEHTTFQVLTPNVPLDSSPSPVGRYREPSLLPDGRILTSWAPGPVNDLNEQAATPPDFGIYLFDPSTQQNQLIYNDKNVWDLNALAIVPRAVPPAIGSLQGAQNASVAVRIGSINVTNTSLTETEDGAEFNATPLAQALQSAVSVRVIEGFSSESCKGVSMFGLTMHEGAAVLGETQVYPDGSWLANVPPYIPIHLQPIDKFGMSIRSQGLWIQGSPGEDRRCVGCHESRTGQGVPAFGSNPTAAEQHGAENLMLPVTSADPNQPSRVQNEYGWNVKAQPIFDAKCIACHNPSTTTYYQLTRTDPVTGLQTTYDIPYLDLTSTPVTAFYDKSSYVWPASYVSIFYPASLMMDMDTKVTGKVPPMWGVPASARSSALIEKINIVAPDGTTAWPIATHPLHPEDVGVTLTAAERKTLILTDDLGGQYYARDNTGFVPFTAGDPVAATAAQ
jgi:Hydrazine synthase alpha subunit middle domain